MKDNSLEQQYDIIYSYYGKRINRGLFKTKENHILMQI